MTHPPRWQLVLDLFLARPCEWINDEDFYGPGGRDAWRTRISDVRKWARERGGRIDNRLVRHDWGTRSQYRLVLPRAAVQPDLFDRRIA